MAENRIAADSSGPGASLAGIAKWKYPILVAMTAILAGTAIYAVIADRREKEKRDITNALFDIGYEASTKPGFDAASAFSRLADNHKGKPVAAQARILEYRVIADKGDFRAAEEILRRFLAEYPDNQFTPRMRLALGQNLLTQNRVSEALAMLRDLLAGTSSEVMPEARLAIAQALARQAEEAADDPAEYHSRLEEARDAYIQLIDMGRRSGWGGVVAVGEFSLVLINDKLAGYTPLPPPSGSAGDGSVGDGESASASLETSPAADPETPPALPKAPTEPPVGEKSD